MEETKYLMIIQKSATHITPGKNLLIISYNFSDVCKIIDTVKKDFETKKELEYIYN